MNPKVDFYFEKNERWGKEIKLLRDIILDCNLNEELKWGTPCYIYQKHNVVLIHVFKDYCALLFFKGALLKDPEMLLIQQTENTQAARQMRFTDVKQVRKTRSIIREYIHEAIEVEKAGLKVVLKKTREYAVPAELKTKLKEMPELKKAFDALTPGRQRGYLLYFGSAKQAKTREARIEKYVKQILKGKGMDD